jgi:hypothetical protein
MRPLRVRLLARAASSDQQMRYRAFDLGPRLRMGIEQVKVTARRDLEIMYILAPGLCLLSVVAA